MFSIETGMRSMLWIMPYCGETYHFGVCIEWPMVYNTLKKHFWKIYSVFKTCMFKDCLPNNV